LKVRPLVRIGRERLPGIVFLPATATALIERRYSGSRA
jgi:hypothetical protein